MAASTKSKVDHNQHANKRKKTGDDSPLPKKKKDEFNEIEFKFLLKDSSTLFTGLEKFVEAAEGYSEGHYDVVASYCRSSPECTEVLQVLEVEKRKIHELQLVFSCLEKILLRIADDLKEKYFSCGMAIIRKLISSYSNVMYFTLNSSHKASQIKVTLKLLVAMVMLGPASSRLIINHFDFTRTSIGFLFDWRDSKDPEDVRTCMVHLIIGLLLSADNDAIRRLADVKGLFGNVFHGIMFDQVSLIQLLLSTVLDKILLNSAVSKTQKVNMFSEDTLRQLVMLFRWLGPQRWKSMLSLKKGKKSTIDPQEVELDEDQTEQRHLVATIAHSFLVELCSSYKHGIVFMDKTYGFGGRNQNHLLTSVVSYLVSISASQPLAHDLVSRILAASPDQLSHFCQVVVSSLSPRLSEKWIDSVRLLRKVYDQLPCEPHIVQLKEPRTVSNLVAILCLYSLPSIQVMKTLLPGLKDKSLAINHVTLGVVKLVAERACSIVKALHASLATDRVRQMYTVEERTDLMTQFVESVQTSLPDALTLFQLWDKQQQTASQTDDTIHLEQLTEYCHTDLGGVQVQILQVLCLYQQLTPGLLTDHPLGLGKLLDGIIHKNSADDEEENEESSELPQLYLLKLLAGTEAKRLPWNRKSPNGHTLIYQLLEMVALATKGAHHKHITRQLMCNLLKGTGLFKDGEEELSHWLQQVQLCCHPADARTTILDFLAQVVLTYLHNPHPYMERVADLRSEVNLRNSGKDAGGHSLDQKVAEILAGDVGSLDDLNSNSPQPSARLPFCPMLLVAVDQLQKMDKVPTGVTVYMSAVLLDTFHLQEDPQPLIAMVTSCPTTLFTHGVSSYIQMWNSVNKDLSTSKHSTLFTKTGELLTVKTLSVLMSAFIHSESSTSSTDVINQYLMHLTYLSINKAKNLKELDTAVKQVSNTLLETVRQIAQSVEPSSPEALPEEFSLLDFVKETAIEKQQVVVDMILAHPTVKRHFLKKNADGENTGVGITGKRNTYGVNSWLPVTEMVAELLSITRHSVLTPELQEFYQDSVLVCLKSVSTTASSDAQMMSLAFNCLKHIIHSIDAEKCVSVVETVLAVVETISSEDVYTVLDNLMDKVLSSKLKIITLSRSTCEAALGCVDKVKHVTAFFKRFPNLAVLCNKTVVPKLLKTKRHPDLASLLMQMNSSLSEEVAGELRQMSRDGLLQCLPLVITYLKTSANYSQAETLGHHVATVMKSDLLELCSSTQPPPSTYLPELCKVLLVRNMISKKVATKMDDMLVESLASDRKCLPHQVELLEQLIRYHGNSLSNKEAEKDHKLVRVCMGRLATVLSDKQQRGNGMEDVLLTVMDKFNKDDLVHLTNQWNRFTDLWPKFVKATLKHLYSDPRLLSFLANIIPEAYADNNNEDALSIETLVAMVMSHSSFLPIMFNEESKGCKGPLLDVLSLLIERYPSSCEPDHVRIYLGAYGATLSLTDQKILRLLQLYEKNGINFSEFKPYLWGEKAIEHHSLYKSMGPALLKVPSMIKVISAIHRAGIQQSILHFPLRRKLHGCDVEDAGQYKSHSGCYDPRFLLPLFSHLLTPDSVVDCRGFVDHGCLGYTLCALSSHDESMRAAACHILTRFHGHLDAAHFLERDQLLYLLDFVQDSMPKPRFKLASIITQFLARTATLLLKPGDHMYGMINSFLLLKPSLDVLSIPEFYKLFNSSALQYKTERAWILSLMHDGMRETADFRIYEKRYTFKLLLSFYDSDASILAEKIKILQILEAACKERTVAMEMTKNSNVAIWILLAINKLSNKQIQLLPHLVRLLHTLWFSMLGRGEHQRETTPAIVLKTAFTSQVLSCLQACLWHFRDSEEDVLLMHAKTSLSVLDYIEEQSNLYKDVVDKVAVVPQTISHADILLLLLHSQPHLPSHVSPHTILRLLSAFSYDTVSLSHQTNQSPDDEAVQKKHPDQKLDKSDNIDETSGPAKASADTMEVDETKNEAAKRCNAKRESSLQILLLKLMLKWMPCVVDGYIEESLAAVLTVVDWMVSQLEVCGDVKLMGQCLHWLRLILDTNLHSDESNSLLPYQKKLIIQLLSSANIGSSSLKFSSAADTVSHTETARSLASSATQPRSTASQILIGLLGLYPKLHDPLVEAQLRELDERLRQKQGAIEHLNSILCPIAETMFSLSEQQLKQLISNKDLPMQADSLRQLLLSKPNDNIDDTDNSNIVSQQQMLSAKKKREKQGKRKSLGQENTDLDMKGDENITATPRLRGDVSGQKSQVKMSVKSSDASVKKKKRKSLNV